MLTALEVQSLFVRSRSIPWNVIASMMMVLLPLLPPLHSLMEDFVVVLDLSPYLLPIVERSLHVAVVWVLRGIVSFALMFNS